MGGRASFYTSKLKETASSKVQAEKPMAGGYAGYNVQPLLHAVSVIYCSWQSYISVQDYESVPCDIFMS